MSPISSTLANASAYGYRTFAAAAAGAYESIATGVGTGSNATITFSSIPSTYTSLQIRCLVRDTSTGTGAYRLDVNLNGDTATNYAYHILSGNGASVTASGVASAAFMSQGTVKVRDGEAAGIMGIGIIDIHDYASTTRNKTVRSFTGYDANGSGYVGLQSGLWMSTSAVTSITLSASTFFTSATVFALYGIKGA